MVEDLELILCALRGKKINSPLMIFKGLVEAVSMAAALQGVLTCLLYVCLLFYILIIIRIVRRSGFGINCSWVTFNHETITKTASWWKTWSLSSVPFVGRKSTPP